MGSRRTRPGHQGWPSLPPRRRPCPRPWGGGRGRDGIAEVTSRQRHMSPITVAAEGATVPSGGTPHGGSNRAHGRAPRQVDRRLAIALAARRGRGAW